MRPSFGATLGGAVATLASALVLVGWLVNIDILIRFFPGQEAMRPASAFALLFAGLSLVCLARGTRAWHRLAMLFAAVSGAIGAELVVTHVGLVSPFAHGWLTDRKEFHPPSHLWTTVGILAASLALGLSGKRRAWAQRTFDFLVLLLVGFAMLCALARLYGWKFSGSSLPTGFALLCIGCGLPFLRPERGIAAMILDPGPKGAVFRLLAPAAVIIPSLLGLLHVQWASAPGSHGLGAAPFAFAASAVFLVLTTIAARLAGRVHEARASEQRSLHELLREREARFRALAEASPQIVWIASPNGTLEYLSSEWTRFVGRSLIQSIGWRWTDAVHPDDLPAAKDVWMRCVQSGEPYESELRLRRHDGRYRWFLSRAVPVRNERGVIKKWYGAHVDIHEVHEARDALRSSEARFRIALQTQKVSVWMQDRDLRYTWIHNPGPRYTAERSLGHTDLELFERSEEALELTELKRKIIESGEPCSCEIAATVAGERRCYELHMNAVLDEKGQVEYLAGAAIDITDRRLAEEAQRRAQHFESMGMLAAGVAHDFNNLLTAIIGNVSFARSALPPEASPRVANMLDNVLGASEAAALLTSQLLAYAGKGRLVVGPVDLAEELTGLKPLLQPSIPRAIELTFEIEPRLSPIEADASQIQQLITNLIMNGVEAIGEQPGRVTVSLSRLSLQSATQRETWLSGLASGDYVLLEVRDTGRGMSAATLARAFDPFFSTKFVGRGLGLSAAQGIARAHGGSIHAVSEENKGATVQVAFPAAHTYAEQLQEEPSTGLRASLDSWQTAARCVLFVDDEAHLRSLAQLALADAGFRVLLANDGAEALELVRANQGEIDAIVLDMSMPVLNGADTARRLREMQVRVPIIASSGYSESEIRASFGGTALDILRKPYRPEELVRKLTALLAGESESRSGSALM